MNDTQSAFREIRVKNCSCMSENREHIIREGTLVKYEDGTYGVR